MYEASGQRRSLWSRDRRQSSNGSDISIVFVADADVQMLTCSFVRGQEDSDHESRLLPEMQ